MRFELSLFFVVQFQVRVLVGLKTSSPAFFRFLFFFRINSLLDVTEMTYIKEQEVAVSELNKQQTGSRHMIDMNMNRSSMSSNDNDTEAIAAESSLHVPAVVSVKVL